MLILYILELDLFTVSYYIQNNIIENFYKKNQLKTNYKK